MNTKNFKMEDWELQHVKDEHINLTDRTLKERLVYGNYDGLRFTGDHTNMASKFENEELAMKVIKLTIEQHIEEIKKWVDFRDDNQIVLKTIFSKQVGHSFVKFTNFKNIYPMYGCTVVLKLGYNKDNFNLITAYPSPNRAIKNKIEEDRSKFLKAKKH